ncbi:MAG: sigma-54 dependent transcriptional regulator [Pseudomonadota bacterium]|nr:sigma-54 dependent transcriptional regulator [Pseudomonadota bacterium]
MPGLDNAVARKPRVLLIEDSPSLAEVYKEYLRQEPYLVAHVATGAEALALIERQPPHALLLDLNLPDMNGMAILDYVTERSLPTSVVIITAHGSIDLAVDAMRMGAYDFLVKPFNAGRLTVTLRNALEKQRLSRLVETLRDEALGGYCGFIGASLAMQAVYRIIGSAAPSRATVFITGESGTGKELCAEAIHRQSPRREGPFIALNCAAIPRDLMESEIFGHVRGAFTGATGERRGAASLADGGTLFLDEICEMDLDLQTKLLRFVQTNSFQPVGGSRTEKVDVRFVCATNRDPLREVEEGRFREDLYYRLHVIPIHLPPLRERDSDVLAIAQRFLADYAAEEGRHFQRFAPEAQAALLDYDWPGNVRQLQNVIRNAVVLNDAETVTAAMLPPPLNRRRAALRPPAAAAKPAEPAAPAAGHKAIRPLEEVEREAIEEAISLCDGNIPKAAALLNISASTIYRKRQAWADQEV